MVRRALPLALLTIAIAFSTRFAPAGEKLAAVKKVNGPEGQYLVLVDPGKNDEFLPAAEAMAALHAATLRRFDPAKLDAVLADLRKAPPQFVVFVMPPKKIDVDLAHQILEMSTNVDADPFVDFEYGFVTGRDGAAALRFVRRIEAAWKRDFERTAGFFAAWDAAQVPPSQPLTAVKAIGFSAIDRCVPASAERVSREKAAKEGFADMKGKSLLLFMSHGYPDSMEGCFRAKDLRDWKADLSGSVLINCACYNGAPGRWFAPGANGPEDRGLVAPEDSVALELIDSGICGYFAGIDPWHGPLAGQIFNLVADDGMRLGEAAKRMYDRLALDFLPKRIHFEPTAKMLDRFNGEGEVNRHHNGAGMIFYGDPALAPFAKTAKRSVSVDVKAAPNEPLRVRLTISPLVDGKLGMIDSLLPEARLMDYYSIKTEDYMNELALEIHRVIPLPAGKSSAPSFQVKTAKSGDTDLPIGKIQSVVENAPGGNLLHIRAPILVRMVKEPIKVDRIIKKGLAIELEEAR